MYAKKMKLQPEANPIDLLRKYAPYLIGAGAAVGTIVSLYYYAFSQAQVMTQDGFDNANEAMEANSRVSLQSSGAAADGAGLDGTAPDITAW